MLIQVARGALLDAVEEFALAFLVQFRLLAVGLEVVHGRGSHVLQLTVCCEGVGLAGEDITLGDLGVGEAFVFVHEDFARLELGAAGAADAHLTCIGGIHACIDGRVENGGIFFDQDILLDAVEEDLDGVGSTLGGFGGRGCFGFWVGEWGGEDLAVDGLLGDVEETEGCLDFFHHGGGSTHPIGLGESVGIEDALDNVEDGGPGREASHADPSGGRIAEDVDGAETTVGIVFQLVEGGVEDDGLLVAVAVDKGDAAVGLGGEDGLDDGHKGGDAAAASEEDVVMGTGGIGGDGEVAHGGENFYGLAFLEGGIDEAGHLAAVDFLDGDGEVGVGDGAAAERVCAAQGLATDGHLECEVLASLVFKLVTSGFLEDDGDCIGGFPDDVFDCQRNELAHVGDRLTVGKRAWRLNVMGLKRRKNKKNPQGACLYLPCAHCIDPYPAAATWGPRVASAELHAVFSWAGACCDGVCTQAGCCGGGA